MVKSSLGQHPGVTSDWYRNEKEGGKKKSSQINQPASIHQGKKFIQVLLNKQ